MTIRKNKLILLGALLLIFGIFLFAFYGFNDDSTGESDNEEEEYNMKRRFPPEEMLERDRKALPKGWPASGVDVVYFWTRPMVEKRMEDFELHFETTTKDEKVVAEEMLGDFAQLQYYFARGLEAFTPWFRQLVVVIPDNVDTRPFNDSDPRVRYVRHSQFIPTDALPIFNWRAILANYVDWDSDLSDQFLFADDMTFLLSYISPSSLRSNNGEIYLPIRNMNISTPLQAIESQVLNNSALAVKNGLILNQEQLGFHSDTIESIAKLDSIPLWETRGLVLLDRHILIDLKEICRDSLSISKLHRFRQTDTVDIIYMHHTFIYWMRELFKQPGQVRKFVTKYDSNKDGHLSRDELIELGKGLNLEQGAIGKWIGALFSMVPFNGSTDIDMKLFFETPQAMSTVANEAVRPRFRYRMVPSNTIAVELRHKIPLRMSLLLKALKSGVPSCLWAGPRLLGPSGSDARETMENVIWYILRNKHSTLESVYTPPAHLGLWIGLGYFSFFLLSTWAISKWLLRPAAKSSD